MDHFAGEQSLEVEEHRAWLRRMSDEELRAFAETAWRRCATDATEGEAPGAVFQAQLLEARAEWRRRHSREWTEVWKSFTDERLEDALYRYVWLSLNTPNPHASRIDALIQECHRRGRS